MKSSRFVRMCVAMTVTFLMLLLGACAAYAQTQQKPRASKASATAPAATPKMRGTTNAQRKAAAARAAHRRTAAVRTRTATKSLPKANAIVGVPGGSALSLGQLYFSGTYPNYANSPLPDLSGNNPACVAPNFCGIRKFVDGLPLPEAPNATTGQMITVAHPDTTTFPGSDYYEISVQQFSEKMHSDLPATLLRGYVQTNFGTDASGNNSVPPDPIHYLGPLIIAQSNRPVRIKFTNNLPTGAPDANGKRPGDLFIPVDKSVMGAGMNADGSPYLENRATVHLHGGNTPWISDGTPHQWTIPAGDWANTLHQRGDSVQFVPDMFFVNGTVVPQCSSTVTVSCSPATLPIPPNSPLPAGASNDPGNGSLTFYYTNQQSARLLFYHDHAYGTTRLNVYAGEAAGYLIQDQVEADLINGTNSSGVNPGLVRAIPSAEIPLIIQDKTFVPNNPASAPVYSLGLLETGSGYTLPQVSFDPAACAVPPQATATAGTIIDPFGQYIYGAVSSLTLVSGGQGCTTNPAVTITDAGGTGTGAAAFASLATLSQQDPTWDTNLWGGPGNLWFPHVYMTNQWPDNPDGSNVNPMGRWDYGSWFWPPFTNQFQVRGPLDCVTGAVLPSPPPAGTTSCPGFPSAVAPSPATDVAGGMNLGMGSVASLTPEAFMDTPIVNGTAYPVLTVQPQAYRFRILSGGNDRTLNLSWFVACGSAGYTPGVNVNCPSMGGTEVPMVPAVATPGFPAWWPTNSYGHDSGVPDPAAMGPNWNVIGNEGGFLAAVDTVPPSPIAFETNPRSVTVTNIMNHSLLLMPAERADVIVDFSAYAGKTLILYNDAPAPAPAFDTRYDYYTGDPDQTGTGGAPSTLPGYGPNTRTIMQVQVAAGAPTPFSLAPLQTLLPAAFKLSQPAPVVPEPQFNLAYGANFPAAYGRLQNNSITFTPIGGTTPVTLPYQMKTIQELFELDYGRMNATLGTELPFTNFNTQTTVPLGYVDPATEIFQDSANVIGQPVGTLGDGSQVWMITHNGVDSHAMHFHLFNVQVLNRFGWDGTTRTPDPIEFGWKDTVRMNPLEIDFVAFRPVSQTLPFPIPDSIRLLDVTMPEGVNDPAISAIGPTGAAASQVNVRANFGWEYVWHCHILGHEENDMMRPMQFQVPPAMPGNLFATPDGAGNVNLTWTDMSASASQPGGGFNVQSAVDSAFTQIVNTWTPATGISLGFGSVGTFTDLVPAQVLWYRVQAFSANGVSQWTAGVQPGGLTTSTTITAPSPITYGTAAPVTVIVNAAGGTATGNVSLTVDASAPLTQALAGNPGSVNFTLNGLTVGTHTVTANYAGAPPFITASTASTQIVVTSPVLTITASSATIVYGSPVPAITPQVVGLVNGDTLASLGSLACSTAYTQTPPTNIVGTYVTTCSGASNPNYVINYVAGTVTVTPKTASVTPSALTKVYGTADPALTGTLTGFIAADGVTAAYSRTLGEAVGSYTISATLSPAAVLSNYTITYNTATFSITQAPASVTPNAAGKLYGQADPALSGTLVGFLPADSVTAIYSRVAGENAGTYVISATLSPTAALANYAITYNTATFTISKAASATAITANTPNPVGVNLPVTVSFGVAPQFIGVPTGNVTVTSSTGEVCTGALTSGAGSCQITFVTPGAKTLVAAYLGDGNFNPSASAPVAQAVGGPVAYITPISLTFAGQLINTTSPAQAVTLRNLGNAPLTINSISITGAGAVNFARNNGCGGTLKAGSSCQISITFRPTAVGSTTASLAISTNDPVNPTQNVALSGTGIAPINQVQPASLSFGNVPIRTNSPVQVVTVTNIGTAAMTMKTIALGGANASQFSQNNNCPPTLAAGANCTVNVTFRPSSKGQKSATLNVNVAAPATSAQVPLTGTGQ